MKKDECIVFGVFNLIYLFVSCFMAKTLAFLLLRLINVFVPVSYYAAAIVSCVTMVTVTVAMMAVLAFFDGYRYAQFDFTVTLISAGAAAAVHFAIGLLARFFPLLFGGVRDMAGLISYGSFFNSASRVSEIPFGTLAVTGLILSMVYVATVFLMKRFGCRKRLRDRAETTGTAETAI